MQRFEFFLVGNNAGHAALQRRLLERWRRLRVQRLQRLQRLHGRGGGGGTSCRGASAAHCLRLLRLQLGLRKRRGYASGACGRLLQRSAARLRYLHCCWRRCRCCCCRWFVEAAEESPRRLRRLRLRLCLWRRLGGRLRCLPR